MLVFSGVVGPDSGVVGPDSGVRGEVWRLFFTGGKTDDGVRGVVFFLFLRIAWAGVRGVLGGLPVAGAIARATFIVDVWSRVFPEDNLPGVRVPNITNLR